MAKRGSVGEASESGKKVKREVEFSETKSSAEWLLKDLKQRGEKLMYKHLKNKKTWVELVCPDMYSRYPYFYMGRAFTGKIIKFIVDKPKRAGMHSGRADGMIKYITGTPGYGKTVSLNTAAAYLYLRSILAVEASSGAQATGDLKPVAAGAGEASSDAQATGDLEPVAGGSTGAHVTGDLKPVAAGAAKKKGWSPEQLDFSTLRFSLLSGEDFVDDPCRVLHAALVLAYIADSEALTHLELLDPDSERDLSRFLRLRTETLHVMVDDANAMDVNEATDSPSLRSSKELAWRFLRRLAKRNANIRVVVCASVRTKLRMTIMKEGAEYCLGTGRFSEQEAIAYLMHKTEKSVEECGQLAKRLYRRTGWVPRLLFFYLGSKSSLKQLKKTLLRNVRTVLRSNDERGTVAEVLQAMAGGKLELGLSDVLDSACYFRGEDGKGQCLAASLHDRAIAYVIECAKDRKLLNAYEQMSLFTCIIAEDSNLARIGWNSEAAVLLAMRLLPVKIPGVDVVIASDYVTLLQAKELSRDMVAEGAGKKVLYIPTYFNHAGVHVYYQCPEALIVAQITVALNPKKCHPKTQEVAERVFEGDERARVVLWITTSLDSRVEQPNTERNYYEVYMGFGELHGALGIIDKRVTEVRKVKERVRKCLVCGEGIQGRSIRCDFCSDLYHEDCVVLGLRGESWLCPGCRMAIGLDEDEKDNVAEAYTGGGDDGDDDDDGDDV